MGNINSTRWKGYTKKTRVEECQRITAREARHVGAPTITEPVANSAARRLWCLCPDCEKRALHLYRLPSGTEAERSGGAWKCRTCHRLTDAKAQEKGTRAAFEKWLTRERWAKISKNHPATARMYQAIGEDYRENVAPFDWDKVNEERRAELLEAYGGAKIVRRVFQKRQDEYAERINERDAMAGATIRADIWEEWKRRNRSQARTKREPSEEPTS